MISIALISVIIAVIAYTVYKMKKISLVADIIEELHYLGAGREVLAEIKKELHKNTITGLKNKLKSIK